MFDKDRSGTLNVFELKKICDLLNLKMNGDQYLAFVQKIDKNGTGVISFNEFVNGMAEKFYRKPTRKELEEVFDEFDTGFLLAF